MNAIRYECELTLPLMERTISKINTIMKERKVSYVISYKYITLLKCKMEEANIFIKQMNVKEDRDKFLEIVAEFHNLANETVRNISK
jgi:hypothetical protein